MGNTKRYRYLKVSSKHLPLPYPMWISASIR